MSKPPSILDRSFRYCPSFSTDVRKTFERIRRERQAEAEQKVLQLHADRPHADRRTRSG